MNTNTNKKFIEFAIEFEREINIENTKKTIVNFFEDIKYKLEKKNNTDDSLYDFNNKMRTILSNWNDIKYPLDRFRFNDDRYIYEIQTNNNFQTFTFTKIKRYAYVNSENLQGLIYSKTIEEDVNKLNIETLLEIYNLINKNKKDVYKEILKLQNNTNKDIRRKIEQRIKIIGEY